MTDAFPMIERCMRHQVAWDAVSRHAWLEERGVVCRYSDSNTPDTSVLPVDRDDLPPEDSYYPIVWEPAP